MVDFRTDLYALGCTIYEMISGRGPFSPRDADTLQVLDAHLNQAPPALPDGTPPALSRLYDRLMHKRRAERPASVREVLDTLVSIEHGRQPPAPASGQADDAALAVAATMAVGTADVQTQPAPGDGVAPNRPSRWRTGVAFVALGIALAGGTLWLSNRGPTQPTPAASTSPPPPTGSSSGAVAQTPHIWPRREGLVESRSARRVTADARPIAQPTVATVQRVVRAGAQADIRARRGLALEAPLAGGVRPKRQRSGGSRGERPSGRAGAVPPGDKAQPPSGTDPSVDEDFPDDPRPRGALDKDFPHRP